PNSSAGCTNGPTAMSSKSRHRMLSTFPIRLKWSSSSKQRPKHRPSKYQPDIERGARGRPFLDECITSAIHRTYDVRIALPRNGDGCPWPDSQRIKSGRSGAPRVPLGATRVVTTSNCETMSAEIRRCGWRGTHEEAATPYCGGRLHACPCADGANIGFYQA